MQLTKVIRMQINVNVNNKTINCKQIKKNTVFFMSDFSSNKFRRVQDRCKACLELLGRYPDSDVPEKFEMISDLYSYLGNATMQLGNLDLALEYHQMDLTIGDQL